jgi:putative SOS response-associated peptidase YedK
MAGSFYEWQHSSSKKQPYRILVKDKPLMPMAAIWTPYNSADGTKTYSCAILTTDANDKIKRIHPRMPVILRHEEIDTWLMAPPSDSGALRSLMKSYDPLQMTIYPVSPLVNSTKVDSPECIEVL